MLKYVSILIFLGSCVDEKSAKVDIVSPLPSKDSILVQDPTVVDEDKIIVHYDLLKEDFNSADSVVLLSHHSPNMRIKNPITGEYYKEAIPFIENDSINYKTSVQERKRLNKAQTRELVDILTIPAVDDGVSKVCFQPRHAVVVFKGSKFSCFDFCFDCYGFARYGEFQSNLIMDAEKYQNLTKLYRKYNFKYELY